MSKFIRELNDEPLYKITLPGRKAPIREGYQYPKRGNWSTWEDRVEFGKSGFHLYNLGREESDNSMIQSAMAQLHGWNGHEALDLWEVESDSVAYRIDGVSVAHRFRLKDRVFQSNLNEYERPLLGVSFTGRVYQKVQEQIDEHRAKRK